MKKTKRYDGEDGSMVGADGKDYGGSSGTGEYAPAPAAPKQRIVTKEELAKSGLSLRDFLNKERGLTRRGEAPAKAPAPPETVTQKTTTTSVSAPTTPPTSSSSAMGPISKRNKMEKEREAEMAATRQKVGESISNIPSSIGNMFSKAMQNYESTRPVSRDVEKQRKQAMDRGNLAKGGKVSSASSRADGIAQRGKTRGKMC